MKNFVDIKHDNYEGILGSPGPVIVGNAIFTTTFVLYSIQNGYRYHLLEFSADMYIIPGGAGVYTPMQNFTFKILDDDGTSGGSGFPTPNQLNANFKLNGTGSPLTVTQEKEYNGAYVNKAMLQQNPLFNVSYSKGVLINLQYQAPAAGIAVGDVVQLNMNFTWGIERVDSLNQG